MNLYSIGFVLLIVATSGGIAYVADILGKKLGKKRLSIRLGKHSLRPKHVASIGTVGMGMLVSLLTIMFVASLSRDAREWLAKGQELLVDLRRLNKDVGVQRGQLLNLKGQVKVYEAKLIAEQNKFVTVQAKVVSLTEQKAALNAELTERSAELAEARQSLEKSRVALALVQRELPSLRASAKEAEAQYRAASSRLETAKSSLVAVNANLKVARAAVRTADINRNVARARFEETAKKSLETYKKNLDLEAEVESRKIVVDSLQKQTIDLEAQRKEAEGRLADVKDQYNIASAQLDVAAARLTELRNVAESQQSFLSGPTFTSRTQKMTFRKDEELARVVVPKGADATVAANALTALLRAARIEAAERGAKGHKADGQTFEVADVFDRQDPKTKAVVSAESLKRKVVARATGQAGDQVLVATSSLNAFGGEPVSLEIRALPNPVVYRRNEMVAEAQIDGSLSDDRILDQLSEFVRSRVRERARQDNMIFREDAAPPFGEIPASDVWKLMGDVKRAGRSVRVQAFAENDTRAADLLKLEFRVR